MQLRALLLLVVQLLTDALVPHRSVQGRRSVSQLTDALAPQRRLLHSRGRRSVVRRSEAGESGAEDEDEDDEDALLERIIEEGTARATAGGSDASQPPPKHRDPVGNTEALTDRFVMAARALRGEYDPEDASEDTEQNSLLSALVDGYPASYTFTAVGKPASSDADGIAALVDELVRTVSAACDGAFVDATVTPRLGGKFASVKLDTTVQSPEVVPEVLARLKADSRITMVF